jgi:hypothetical protein
LPNLVWAFRSELEAIDPVEELDQFPEWLRAEDLCEHRLGRQLFGGLGSPARSKSGG